MAEGKKALKAMRDDVQDERVKEGEQIHRGEVLEEGIGHSIEVSRAISGRGMRVASMKAAKGTDFDNFSWFRWDFSPFPCLA